MNIALSFTLAALLAIIHLWAYKWTFFESAPKNMWLSFGGGISVSYVFLEILPELHEGQHVLEKMSILTFLEDHVFLLSLSGLVFFYGLERLAIKSHSDKEEENYHPHVFWIHLISFAIYNMMIGYILHHREEQSFQKIFFFILAIAAHFLVNDFGFQKKFRRLYVSKGRWILALSILCGWSAGAITQISQSTFVILLALISGGIILNVLKEELPEEKEGRFKAFLLGVVLNSIALLWA
jgi:zinc transporter ZupT